MKIKYLFSAFAGMLLMMSSCSQDDIMNDLAPEKAAPGVYVRLTGAAAVDDNAPATRATIAAETTEKTINSVVAALFDINDGFYKTVDATKVGTDGTYTFSCEKDGTYDVYLIANANADLKAALKAKQTVGQVMIQHRRGCPTETEGDDFSRKGHPCRDSKLPCTKNISGRRNSAHCQGSINIHAPHGVPKGQPC